MCTLEMWVMHLETQLINLKMQVTNLERHVIYLETPVQLLEMQLVYFEIQAKICLEMQLMYKEIQVMPAVDEILVLGGLVARYFNLYFLHQLCPYGPPIDCLSYFSSCFQILGFVRIRKLFSQGVSV
jgi:hypothetical protein